MIDLVVEKSVEAEGCALVKGDVDHVTVHIGEEAELGVDGCACLGAAEVNLADICLDVEAEACFYAEYGSVVEADEGGGEVFDIAYVFTLRAVCC